MDLGNKAVIPLHSAPERLIHFSAYKIDINDCTLDGKHTLHATLYTTWQIWPFHVVTLKSMTPAKHATFAVSSWGHEHYIPCQWHWCHHWTTVWQRYSGSVVWQIIFGLECSINRSFYLNSARWSPKNMNLTPWIQLLKECKLIWSETCRNYCWLGTISTTCSWSGLGTCWKQSVSICKMLNYTWCESKAIY